MAGLSGHCLLRVGAFAHGNVSLKPHSWHSKFHNSIDVLTIATTAHVECIYPETEDRLYSGRLWALYFHDIDSDVNVGGEVVRSFLEARKYIQS